MHWFNCWIQTMMSDHTCLEEIQTCCKNSMWKGLKYSKAFPTLYNPSITTYQVLVRPSWNCTSNQTSYKEAFYNPQKHFIRLLKLPDIPGDIIHIGFLHWNMGTLRTRGKLPKFGKKQLSNQSNLDLFYYFISQVLDQAKRSPFSINHR